MPLTWNRTPIGPAAVRRAWPAIWGMAPTIRSEERATAFARRQGLSPEEEQMLEAVLETYRRGRKATMALVGPLLAGAWSLQETWSSRVRSMP